MAVAIGVAGAVAVALAPELEINPGRPPGTVLTPPWLALAGTTAVVALLAVLAVGYAQRRVGRATPGEVLRDVAG